MNIPELALSLEVTAESMKLSPSMMERFKDTKIISFDIETNTDPSAYPDVTSRAYFLEKGTFGLSYLTQMTVLGLYADNGAHTVITHEELIEDRRIRNFVHRLFDDSSILFVAHNIVFDLRILCGHYRLPIPQQLWCTYSNDWAFGDTDTKVRRKLSLASLINFYQIDAQINSDDDIFEQFGSSEEFLNYMKAHRKVLHELPDAYVRRYVLLDVLNTYGVCLQQMARVKRIEPYYSKIREVMNWEGRFNRACVRMAVHGIPVNRQLLEDKISQWTEEIIGVTKALGTQTLEFLRQRVQGELRRAGIAVEVTDELMQSLCELYTEFKYYLQGDMLFTGSGFKQLYCLSVLGCQPDADNPDLWTERGRLRFNAKTLAYYAKQESRVERIVDYANVKRYLKKVNMPSAIASLAKGLRRMEIEFEADIVMALRGRLLDLLPLPEYMDSFQFQDIQESLSQYMDITGQGFNPSRSSMQSLYFLEVLGIRVPPYSAATTDLWTSGGVYGEPKPSFGKAALAYYEQLYPEVESYIRYAKLNIRLIKAQELLAHIAPDGKTHSTITTSTVTGRTSSKNPNLQNLNLRPDQVLHDDAFVGVFTASPGYVLLENDVSNAETYMAAMMAADSVQMQALYDADFHSTMAAAYFADRWEAVKDDPVLKKLLRSASKAITFGTAYGMGANKLARNPAMHAVLDPESDEHLNAFIDLMFFAQEYDSRIPDDDLPGQYDLFLHAHGADTDIVTLEFFAYVVNQCNWFPGYCLPESLITADRIDWVHAYRVMRAREILDEKDRAFPATTKAKELATRMGEQHWVEMWTGRRVFVSEARKAWNSICQGGVGELVKRWLVLIAEWLEKEAWLDTTIVGYIHDSLIFHVPLEYAEIVTKMANYLLTRVMETQPLDKFGKGWEARTDPPVRWLAGVEHDENRHKWGHHPTREYPFAGDWGLTTQDELKALWEQAKAPVYRAQAFLNRRFLRAEDDQGGDGMSLSEYLAYLRYRRDIEHDVPAERELAAIEAVLGTFKGYVELEVV